MASRQTRTELTIKEKLEIIRSLKDNKCTQKDIQERFKISKHTIDRILLRADDLRSTKNSKTRRIRSRNNRLVDDAVSKWYRSMLEQNIYVNGPLLRQQAVRFARMMNNHTFEANNGWLWRWQQRENVKFNSSYSAKKAIINANNSVNINRDTNELSENKSLQSCADSDKISGQPFSNQLEGSGVSHFEINVKEEEIDDVLRNPFEADVVFDNESDEHGGYANGANQNNYSPECLNVNGEEIEHDQGEVSMDHVSFQENGLYNQPVEIQEELNDHRMNDSEEESERYSSQKKSEGVDKNYPKDIFSIYGDYIARRLRASATERENYEIYIAQHNIDDVIFKLSMGSYARVLPSPSYLNSRIGNDVEQTRQSRQKQRQASIIKEKQTFNRNSKTKNSLQDVRSPNYVVDKSNPAFVHDFSIEKTYS